jgi:cytochrome c-type biogenesis protein CcmH/NrfG
MAKTLDQPVEKPAEGVASTAKPVKVKRKLSFSPNLASFVVVVVALGYLIYGSWQAFQTPKASGTPQASATPSIPVLKLNQDNKREAPPITVDQDGIGKQNPFAP